MEHTMCRKIGLNNQAVRYLDATRDCVNRFLRTMIG